MTPPDSTLPTLTEYTCIQCKRTLPGRYVSGGWWQHPVGWFQHDDGQRWACGLLCAQAASSSSSAPAPGADAGAQPRKPLTST